MKAANLLGPKNLVYEDVNDPICPNDGIIVRIHACGICGSDLRTYLGGSSYAEYPAVMGHEITGEIVESDNSDYKVGNLLTIAPVIPCGECHFCKRGWQNLCDNLKMIGIAKGIDGGFAEYMTLTSEILRKGCVELLPEGIDNIPTIIAEPASSCFACQENANVSLRDNVLIIGAGTMGLLNGIISKLRGANKVIVVDSAEQKIKFAKDLGFDLVINEFSSHNEVYETVMENTSGRGMDVVITACPSSRAQADALKLAMKRGKVIFFGGLGKNAEPHLDANLIHYKEVRIYGANAYAPRHFRKALDLILEDKIKARAFITKHYKLSDLENGFKDMQNGVILKGIYDYSL